MATYSFRIKKGKFLLELSTSDRELLVEQFEKWVKEATIYARKKKANECKDLVNSQIQAEAEITQKNIDNHLAKHPVAELPKLDEPVEKKEVVKTDVSKEKNLDVFYAPPSTETLSERVTQSNSGGIFDSILSNSLNNNLHFM